MERNAVLGGDAAAVFIPGNDADLFGLQIDVPQQQGQGALADRTETHHHDAAGESQLFAERSQFLSPKNLSAALWAHVVMLRKAAKNKGKSKKKQCPPGNPEGAGRRVQSALR
jgi:hypothetical protein